MGDWADMFEDLYLDEVAEDVTVAGTIMNTTTKAILIDLDDGDEPSWLPKSQLVEQDWDHLIGEEVAIVVPGWLASKKGWLDSGE